MHVLFLPVEFDNLKKARGERKGTAAADKRSNGGQTWRDVGGIEDVRERVNRLGLTGLRLGLGLGPVLVFTVTSFILIYTNKLTVSYGGP